LFALRSWLAALTVALPPLLFRLAVGGGGVMGLRQLLRQAAPVNLARNGGRRAQMFSSSIMPEDAAGAAMLAVTACEALYVSTLALPLVAKFVMGTPLSLIALSFFLLTAVPHVAGLLFRLYCSSCDAACARLDELGVPIDASPRSTPRSSGNTATSSSDDSSTKTQAKTAAVPDEMPSPPDEAGASAKAEAAWSRTWRARLVAWIVFRHAQLSFWLLCLQWISVCASCVVLLYVRSWQTSAALLALHCIALYVCIDERTRFDALSMPPRPHLRAAKHKRSRSSGSTSLSATPALELSTATQDPQEQQQHEASPAPTQAAVAPQP
jgi:hypothetical protein